MPSYTNFLPRSGGGTSVIGSIFEFSSNLPNLLTTGDGSYLKEGFVLTGEESTYPEAFTNLNNKGGRGWDLFKIPASMASTSRIFRGIKKTPHGIICVFTDGTTVYLLKIDPEQESVEFFKSFYAITNLTTCGFSGTDIVLTTAGGVLHVLRTGEAYGSLITIATGLPQDFRTMTETNDGFILTRSSPEIHIYNKVYTKLASYSVSNLTSGGLITTGRSFVNNDGDKITMLVTSRGDILWSANTDLTSVSHWSKRYTSPTILQATSLVYSKAADLVFVGFQEGEYLYDTSIFTNPTLGNFKGTASRTFNFIQGGNDTIFCTGGFNNSYFRFDTTTRQWEPYNLGTSVTFNVKYIVEDIISEYAPDQFVSVGAGATPYGSNHFILHSYDSIGMFPSDSLFGNISRYLRIK